MTTRSFVSGSSILLLGWLAVTFLKEVPSQEYRKLDKKTAGTSLTGEIKPAAVEPIQPLELPVSVSR